MKFGVNEKKVFKKYLSRYLLIGMLLILCCIPFGVNTYDKIKEYAIVTSVKQVEDGIQQLCSDVEKMNLITSILGEETCFLELKRINGDIPMEKYLYMKDAKERLNEMIHISDFSSYAFCLFRNNDAFISNNQVSESLPDYYNVFTAIEGLSEEEFREALLNQCDQSSYLVAENFFYTGSDKTVTMEDAVLYLQPVGKDNFWNSRRAVIAFTIEKERYLKLLIPDDMRDDALLYITDNSGQEIVTYGADVDILRQASFVEQLRESGKSYRIFHYKQPDSGLDITVAFSMHSIYDQMINIGKLLLVYILCGSLLAVILTVLCTFIWYKPFAEMLTEVHRLSGRNVERSNEYDYVRESLLKLVSDKDEMETKLLLVNAEKQAIMLEKVFMNGFLEPELKEQFIQQVPFCTSGYYIVIIGVRQLQAETDIQLGLLYASEVFQREGGRHFVQIYPKNNMAVYLVADETEQGGEKLKEILATVCDLVTEAYPLRFVAGISKWQGDIEKINVAFAQARQTVNIYKLKDRNCVEAYSMAYDSEINCFHVDAVQKLYDMILAGNREAIRDSFAEMKRESRDNYEKYGFQNYEIYYAINFCLRSVCQQKALSVVLHSYSNEELQNMTLMQELEELEAKAYMVCEVVEENKSRKNDAVRERLMEYMRHNFSRSELTVDLVAREVDTSEKYVYSIIREDTGKTFSAYLEELRVNYAKECLITTNWSNERIAQEAGFGATNSFYRVFKKCTGMSPNVYKKAKLNI